MEYHSVPLEERAKDEKGNTLPWGYVYKDESRNPRRPPEETGPFGKRRNTRYGSTRSATRTGTPAKRENPNVAEFGRLFSLQQEEEAQQKLLAANNTTSNDAATSRTPGDSVATECILYGYKDKGVEWKVIDKFERISLGYICEDYSRSDPEINPKYPQLLSGGDVVIRPKLSADANRKSKRYAGGAHWIKVTFDSFAAADRACHFSPQEIDGCLVHCEMYHGHGPQEDAPILKATLEQQSRLNSIYPSLKPSSSASLLQSNEYDRSSLPRSFSYTQSNSFEAPASVQSTATASSATVMGQNNIDADTLRQRPGRSQPEPEAEAKPAKSEFMTHIPTVRRAVVRPASEALPPQPSMTERVLRSIPILSWFTGDIVGDGPALREDGSFDDQKSNLYWRFWHMVDMVLGTDLCGLREEI